MYLKEIQKHRLQRGNSLLLFLTFRCPISCSHCSMNAGTEGACIQDFSLLGNLLTGVAGIDSLKMVAISGGEPFSEKRGLTLAVDMLYHAGKKIVLYSNGFWAKNSPPTWIKSILSKTSAVFLSTDQYHQEWVTEATLIKACQAVLESGSRPVVQILDFLPVVEQAKNTLQKTFGQDWESSIDMNLIPFISYGRASQIKNLDSSTEQGSTGFCYAINSPTLRYDGTIFACCQEQVITGEGPSCLRYQVSSASEIQQTLENIARDPVFSFLSQYGFHGLIQHHPLLQDISWQNSQKSCEICWQILNRLKKKNC